MRSRHNVETTKGEVGIVFHPTYPNSPNNSITVPPPPRSEDWTKHGLAAAVNYAATFFERDNMHEYYSRVELFFNDTVIAVYTSTQPRNPNFVR